MDCAVVDLIAYHFATLEDAERDRVDEHLVACTSCLRAYLRLKHQFERGVSADRPSAAAHARLRRAVEERFRPTPAARVRRFFARPIPMYQGLAAAAVALLIASLASTAARAAPRPASGPYVDSSRPSAESLTIY